jgi:hypothetical protein
MNDSKNSSNQEPAGYDPASLEMPTNTRLNSDYTIQSEPTNANSTSSHSANERKFYLMHFSRSLFVGVICVLVAALFVAGILIIVHSSKSKTNSSGNKTNDFSISNLNVSDALSSSGLQLGQVNQIEINGQLKVNGSVVLAPISQPTKAVAGELYYDQTSNKPYYYNGSQFESLGGTTQQQVSVSSIQGQSGNVSFTSGGGIMLNGTEIINSGVTSLAGTDDQINVSQANGGVTLSLPQAISSNSTPDFAGVVVSNVSGSGSGLAVGGLNQSLSLQGSATTISDSNNGFTTEVEFATPTGNNVLTIPDVTGEICTSANNCGSGSSTPGVFLQMTTPGTAQTGDFNISGTGIVGVLIGGDIQSSTAEISGVVNAGSISTIGSVSAGSFSGNGANVTNVNASELNGQAASYYLNASNINSGTLSDARLSTDVVLAGNNNALTGNNSFSGSNNFSNSGNTFTGDGSGLSNLNASVITSGTLADARLSTDVTLAGNTFNGDNELLQINSSGALPVISGVNLTNLNASNINSGVLSVSFGGTGASNAAAARTNLLAAESGSNSDITSLLDLTTITPSSALTVGSTSQNLTLQGAATELTSTIGGHTVTLGFTTPTATDSIIFPDASGTVCLTSGNCTSGSVTGSGTANTVPIFTSGQAIGNSIISQNSGGTIVTVGGSEVVTGTINSQTISSTANFTGSLTLPTLNATSVIELNGTNINTGGTLSDVAYLDQANTFSKPNTIVVNSGSAFVVQNSSSAKVLQVDTTSDDSVGINGASTSTGYNLNVTGSGNFSSSLTVNGVAVCLVTSCAAGSAGSYIDNGTATQTGNFNVQSASAGTVAAVIQGAASQSADILDIKTSSATALSVTSAGNTNVANNLSVNGTTNLTGLLTASGGLSDVGILSQTGTTNINTTGSSITSIGDSTSSTSIGGSLAVTGSVTSGTINGQTISSAANFTSSLTVPTLNATSQIQLNGTNINTVGTLSDVAYLDQANAFTKAESITVSSNNGLLVQNSSSKILQVDTNNSAVGINGASTSAGYNLNVTGTGNFSTGLSINGVAVCTVSTCSGGSGSFINNGTAVQTANFNIKSASASSIAAVIQGASSQTADLLDIDNPGGGTVLFGVANDGSITTNGSLNVGGGASITGNINSQTISNVANFTGSLNVANTIKLGGTSINVAGTLSNVAYLNQANLFGVSSTVALVVENSAGTKIPLTVDTTDNSVGIAGALTTAGYALNVGGSGYFAGNLASTGTVTGTGYYIGSNSINTAGTLSNVAYLNQANTFTNTNTFTNNSTTGLLIQNTSSQAVFDADTNHRYVLVATSTPITDVGGSGSLATLQVSGTIDATGVISEQGGQQVCTVTVCGSSGLSTSFIQNLAATSSNYTTTYQTANISILSAATNDIGEIIQGSTSQSADLLDLETNFGSTPVIQAAFGAAGNLNLRQTTNTTSALSLQNAAGQYTLNFDNTSDSLLVSQGDLYVLGVLTPASSTLTLNTTGGSYTKNSSYYYEVSAVNGSGTSIAATPTPSSIKDTTNNTGSGTLTWTSVANATSYDIFREIGTANWFYVNVPTSNCSGGTCTITDTGSNYTYTLGGPNGIGGTSGLLTVTGNITGASLSVTNAITAGTYVNIGNGNSYEVNGYNVLTEADSNGNLSVGTVNATASGTNFTAIGVGANTAGTGPTAVGNTAVASGEGTSVGFKANAGQYSTALGYNAGDGASGDVAVGYESLAVSSYGTNTAVGTSALEYDTTGNGNVAVGDDAGSLFSTPYGVTTGSNDSFLGAYSGQNDYYALQNATAIGQDSIVAANNNVALGCTNGVGDCTATSSVSIASSGYAAGLFSVGNSIYNTGTITQTGSTITGTGTTFTPAMNGATIYYYDGTTATVNYVDATHLTSSVSKSVTNYSTGTISQPGTSVITGSGTTFNANMVGEILTSGATSEYITSYTSPTVIGTNSIFTITAGSSFTITSPYTLVYSGFNISNSGNGYVGIGTSAPGNLLSVGALTTASAGAQIAVSTGGATNSGITVETVAGQSSGYILQALSSSGGSPFAYLDYQGNLLVKTATVSGNLTVNGHVITGNTTGSTTATVSANAGTGSTCTVSGDDTAGQITVITGSASWASGVQCTINFSSSYASSPHPIMTSANATSRSVVQPYIGSTTGTMTINFTAPDTTSNTYIWNYFNAQ